MPQRKATARDTCRLLADTEGPSHWGWRGVMEKRRTFLMRTKVDTFFSFFFLHPSPPCSSMLSCLSPSRTRFTFVLRDIRTTDYENGGFDVSRRVLRRPPEKRKLFASIYLRLGVGIDKSVWISHFPIAKLNSMFLALSVFGSVFKV